MPVRFDHVIGQWKADTPSYSDHTWWFFVLHVTHPRVEEDGFLLVLFTPSFFSFHQDFVAFTLCANLFDAVIRSVDWYFHMALQQCSTWWPMHMNGYDAHPCGTPLQCRGICHKTHTSRDEWQSTMQQCCNAQQHVMNACDECMWWMPLWLSWLSADCLCLLDLFLVFYLWIPCATYCRCWLKGNQATPEAAGTL